MTSAETEAESSAIELAATYVSVLGATNKLARSIRDAVQDGQRYAREHPISLRANVDVSHIGAIQVPVIAKVNKAKLREELRGIDNLHADVGLRTTVAERNRFATELTAKLRERRFLVHLTPALDQRALREEMARLPSGTVKLELEVTNAEFQRFARDLRQRLRDANVQIPVGLDLTGLAAFRAALDELTRRRSVDVDVNRRGGLGRLGGGGDGLDLNLSKAAGATAAVAAGLATIGGAAGAALGAVAALGVGLAALGPAAAAAAATAAVGLSGVGDAFKALSAASESSASDGQAQAKAVAAAQEQVVTALENVESAQRNLSDAQKDARDATKDIAQAYKDAADELEDYQLQLADAALSEKEAALALREAQEELAKASPKDREKALLRVERAQLRLAEAQEKNRDTQEAASEAEAKGIEGSDKVVTAKERAATADQKVVDAEKALTKAQGEVTKAQAAVTEAMNKGSSAQDKAAQALAKLSPNAREFVLAARELAPLWNDLVKNPTQDALFADSAAGIKDLATAALPVLGAGMTAVATSMNGLTKQFATFWKAPENLEGIRAAFAGTSNFIAALGPGLQQATKGFLSLGQAFEPVATKVGAQFAGMLGQIGQAFTNAFESGALTKLISTFGDILQGLGEGLQPLIEGLIQMGNIVGPTLGPLFKQLGESLGALAPSLGALGATFVKTFTAILPDIQKFIAALATGLEPVLPVVGDLLQSLLTALTPLIGPLSQIAQVVGQALSQAITALAPAIGPLGEAFASLVTAVAPLLPVLAQVISAIVQALAPALTTIFDALTPVIQQLVAAFVPVIEKMQPILAETAMTIGQALAGALEQLAPLLPQLIEAWAGLELAIAPVLPQLVKMITDLLPPLIDLFVEFAPLIIKMTEAFTWLVSNVLVPLVIPTFQTLADTIKFSLESSVAVVRWVKEHFGSALKSLGEAFTSFGQLVADVWRNVVIKNIARGVNIIGGLLQKIPDWVPGSGGARSLGTDLTQWAAANMATGGLLRGKGTGTSDSMLIAASNGEFVVNAAATSKTLPLLEAINAGWTPSAADLHKLFPGFATGGLVAAQAFARGESGKPYDYGGVGNPYWDCSGFMGGIWAVLNGKDPRKRYFTTESDFSQFGFLPGIGGKNDFSIGVSRGGGGPNSHMAGTLGDLDVESGGNGTIAGPAAMGAADFPLKFHFPILGNPADAGTAPSSPGTGGGIPNLGTGNGGGTSNTGTGGSGGGTGTNTTGATNVFVTNWPTGFTGTNTGTETTPTTSDPTTPTTAPTTSPSSTSQLNDATSTVDVPGRLATAGQNFLDSNIDQFLGDIGARKSGGALQELVSVIQKQMASTIAEELRKTRAQATSFIGRR